ncbi:MAG: DMT family transporter [Gammaproteobacteria bacterium]|nr:DMT family transporter [Gammaproteobacteria bacterium]
MKPVWTASGSAYLMLLVTTFCWGMNAVLGRLAVGEVQPMLFVTLRWVVVVVLLIPLAWRPLVDDWPVLRPRLAYIAFMGATLSLFSILFYNAAYTTTAINIGILQGSIPILILLAAWVTTRQPLSLWQLIGVLVTLLGVIIVATEGRWDALATLTIRQGDQYMLLACVIYAVYSTGLSRKPVSSPFSFFAAMVMPAFLFSLPFAFYEAATIGLTAPTVRGWWLVVVTGVFTSLVAQMLYIKGVGLIGASRAGVFVNLVPIFAALLAVLVLAEDFKLYHAVSLTLVLGGIALSEWVSTRGR